MALGVPIQCDITTSTGTVKLYKDAGSDMRTEMSVSEGPCPTIVSIETGGTYYVGCEQGTLVPGSNCQWLMFSTNGTAGVSLPSGYQEPDYSGLPAAQITCVPWATVPSLLQAPSNACNLQDLVPQQSG
jgi:hypothetical protein